MAKYQFNQMQFYLVAAVGYERENHSKRLQTKSSTAKSNKTLASSFE